MFDLDANQILDFDVPCKFCFNFRFSFMKLGNFDSLLIACVLVRYRAESIAMPNGMPILPLRKWVFLSIACFWWIVAAVYQMFFFQKCSCKFCGMSVTAWPCLRICMCTVCFVCARNWSNRLKISLLILLTILHYSLFTSTIALPLTNVCRFTLLPNVVVSLTVWVRFTFFFCACIVARTSASMLSCVASISTMPP